MNERVNSDPDVTLLLKRSIQAIEDDPKEAKRRFKAAAAAAAPPKPVPCPHCGVKHRTLTADQCVDRKMSERTLQDRVVGRAKRRGWKVAHAGKGWVGDQETGVGQFITPMSKGWPDLTLAKEGHRLIFMELKTEQGEVEPEQEAWLILLNQCGCRAIVVRPSVLRDGRVNAILTAGSPL